VTSVFFVLMIDKYIWTFQLHNGQN